MRTFLSCCLILLLFVIPVRGTSNLSQQSISQFIPPIQGESIRSQIVNAVIATDSDPYFSLIASSAACWYDKAENISGLIPLLVHHKGTLTSAQQRFLTTYLTSPDDQVLILGERITLPYHTIEILGSPPTVASTLATQSFTTASTVLINPYGSNDAYRLSLLATPLADYLNIPLLLYDNNQEELQTVCTQLHTTDAYVVGTTELHLTNVTITPLRNEEVISHLVLSVIQENFGSINYLTLTNPSDVIPQTIINTTDIRFTDHVTNKKFIVMSKAYDISGNDTRHYKIVIPDGLNKVQIFGEINQKRNPLIEKISPIVPLIFLTLTDPQGHTVAYANSMGYEKEKTYLETITCNASGEYLLMVKVYHGIKGGYFLQRGFSSVDADITINTTITHLAQPDFSLISNLSMLAPYLTAAHGGLLIANTTGTLIGNSYLQAAQGSGTGPWYNASLLSFNNEKVNTTVEQVKTTLQLLDSHHLLNGYLAGPAWLTILADTTMIPMYYYGPSQEDIPERGLPSDNPYSLQENLSVGRIIGWDVQDVSVLFARTFFYENLCGQPEQPTDWQNRFTFVFGEGFGETGGIFHQIPYAQEIKKYGFTTTVYGDLRNSRQLTSLFHAYTGANYIEYLGHGDWFWMPASLYGFDMYSKAVDVAHAKEWVYEKPSIFLTAGCLMGRTDGLPPRMNIGLAMLHTGCNAFIGATRETGQESSLTTLENHLIVDNWSIGQALRGEKRVDKELPTYDVRVLYGDPAFNPYEPNHGFSNQGRPSFPSE